MLCVSCHLSSSRTVSVDGTTWFSLLCSTHSRIHVICGGKMIDTLWLYQTSNSENTFPFHINEKSISWKSIDIIYLLMELTSKSLLFVWMMKMKSPPIKIYAWFGGMDPSDITLCGRCEWLMKWSSHNLLTLKAHWGPATEHLIYVREHSVDVACFTWHTIQWNPLTGRLK